MVDNTTPIVIFVLISIAMILLLFFKGQAWKKAAVIGVLFWCGVMSYRSINSRAGLPVIIDSLNKEEVTLLGYHPDMETSQIYIWVIRGDSKIPETLRISYSENNKKQLEKATEGEAKKVKITVRKKKNLDRFDDQEVEIEIKRGSLPKKD